MRTVAVDVLLWAGVALLLVCSAGVLTMRSAFDRLHYSTAASWGVLPIAAAILMRESWSLIGDKALAIAFLLMVLGPVLGHATARAGRIREQGAWNAHGHARGPAHEHGGREQQHGQTQQHGRERERGREQRHGQGPA